MMSGKGIRRFHYAIYQLVICCLLISVIGSACGSDAPKKSDSEVDPAGIANISHTLSTLAGNGLFSGVVLLKQNGKELLRKAYGMADEAHNVKNTVNTQFRIAEITMQFTAAAILLLQDQGKLRLQDQICKYLKQCPQQWKPITIEELLMHTSGIPQLLPTPQGPLTPDQYVGSIARQPLGFTPGKPEDYNNYSSDNYILLGAIVEKVSGQLYKDFVQKNILDVIGLKKSGYGQSGAIATGYEGAGTPAQPVDVSVLYAAGALYSTVDDLYTWEQALFNHHFASQSVSTGLTSAHFDYCGGSSKKSCYSGAEEYDQFSVGYGIYIEKKHGRTSITIDAGGAGYSGEIVYYPREKITIVVLSNLTEGEQTISDLLEAGLFPSITGQDSSN